jgi:hypothetical protein
MKIKKDRDRYFRTTSLPLAIYLYTKDQQVAGVDSISGNGKKEFAFVSTSRLEELVQKYKFGERSDPELLVPVHLYELARNELLDRLNGN